jgi:site-specific DNA-methyltransferase (adenine-specific)
MDNMNLLLGDCLELMKQLPDESVDAVVTDPPYGILTGHKIETDVDIPRFFRECQRVLKPNSFLVYFGMQPTLTFWNIEAFKLFRYKNEIIWYKRHSSFSIGANDMRRYIENIMVCIKGSKKFNEVRRPYMDVKESLSDLIGIGGLKADINYLTQAFKDRMTYENAIAYLDATANGGDMKRFYTQTAGNRNDKVHTRTKKEKKVILKVINNLTNGYSPQNIVSFTPHNKQRHDSTGQGLGDHNIKHPAVKPVQLLNYLLDLTTQEGDLVLDPFMGSGTTGVACQELGRRFIGMELHEEYFNIAKQRILGGGMRKEVESEQLNLFGKEV